MESLRYMLAILGNYEGDGLQAENLNWMLRVGACSYQYEEFLDWLELQVNSFCTLEELDWAQELLNKLHNSRLQIPHEDYQNLDPTTYRCHALQMLVLLLHDALNRSNNTSTTNARERVCELFPQERFLLADALKKHRENL